MGFIETFTIYFLYISMISNSDDDLMVVKKKVEKENQVCSKGKKVKTVQKRNNETKIQENTSQNKMSLDLMLDEMRSSVENTVSIKRKKLEIFAHHCSSNHKKVEEEIRSQTNSRNTVLEEYEQQFSSIISQYDQDYQKAKEVEDKIRSLLNQQMKLISQERQVHQQRIKSLKKLHEKFIQSMESIEDTQSNKMQQLIDESKTKINSKKKEFVEEMTKDEIMNIRHSVLKLNRDY